MGNRVTATILYSTETGKSESYAHRIADVFQKAFNTEVSMFKDFFKRKA